jgi:hypothetical protein
MAGGKETEKRRLTIAELRKMKNYENVSEEQAQEIIFAVRNLAVMFYEHLNKKQKEKEMAKEDEQKDTKMKAEKSKTEKTTSKRKKSK